MSAALVAGAGAAVAALATRAGDHGLLACLAAALLAGALPGHGRVPRAAAAVAAAGLVLLLAAPSAPTLPVLLVAANGFGVARRLAAAWAVPFAVLALAAVRVGVTDDALVPNLLVLGGLLAAGRALRTRDLLTGELAQRGAELDEEREVFAELSVRYERSRIAAELHDIVAHAISVMVVQAGAGQRLAAVDPTATEDAFAAIGEAARHAKADVARLVALLADDAVEAGETDLGVVRELIARAAQTGLDVTLRLEGDRSRIAAPAARSAFLVVREGLTNALRYAGGAAVRVRIDAGEDAVLVEVVDDGATASAALDGLGTGHGLRGLREQLDACGGWLQAGATDAGGWRLAAGIPRAGAVARTGSRA